MHCLHLLAAVSDPDSNWWLKDLMKYIVPPLVTFVLGWGGQSVRMKYLIKKAGLDLSVLKQRREILDVKPTEKIRQGHDLIDLVAKTKEQDVTIPELAEMQNFVMNGVVVPKATQEQVVQHKTERIHIVQQPDGAQRNVWTDPKTKQEVYEFQPRTVEEIKQMQEDISVWISTCEHRRRAETKPTDMDELIAFYDGRIIERIKNFPHIANEDEHNLAFSKMLALGWALGYPYGWPLADYDKPVNPSLRYLQGQNK